jgi:hypothetical protein
MEGGLNSQIAELQGAMQFRLKSTRKATFANLFRLATLSVYTKAV